MTVKVSFLFQLLCSREIHLFTERNHVITIIIISNFLVDDNQNSQIKNKGPVEEEEEASNQITPKGYAKGGLCLSAMDDMKSSNIFCKKGKLLRSFI